MAGTGTDGAATDRTAQGREPSGALSAEHPLVSGRTSRSPLITAYAGKRPDVLPVWFMRQAGRSLPEYRELRAGIGMLDSCLDPAMASEITLQPVRRHKVDAGIFYSDIVVPLKLAGVDIDIVSGKGPVLGKPVRTADEVAALPTLDPDALTPVADGVRATVAGLAELGDIPLIGFGGAPFTLAAYLVEGGPSKDHIRARTLMHSDPDTWQALMAWAADITGTFLRAQVLAGASAAQLFDSWAGALSLEDYTRHVAPASARALSFVRDLSYPDPERAADAVSAHAVERNVPIVHFGVGTSELLRAMHDIGTDVIGVDYRVPLDEASRRLGNIVPLQGNIDPAYLDAPWPVLEAHVRDVVQRGRSAPSHVLNLGHGVPPETDPTVLTRIVELVHGLGE
ncbi:uroporphyrinogen decarboxylase [Rathayibacter sp. CAU 1779]